MSGFRHESVDALGRKTSGVLEADNPRLARARLREQGLIPIRLEAVLEEAKSSGPGRRAWRGPRPVELALVTRQLATLLAAGLTVEEALGTGIEQSESQRVKTVLAGIRGEVLGGNSLAKAMANYPSTFDDLYRAVVTAGEDTGKLAAVLERLADYLEGRNAMRQRVGLAFIYPALVSIISVLVVTGLLTYVVPQIAEVFRNSSQTLPLLTRLLMGLADVLRNYGLLGLLALVAGILIFNRLLRHEAFRHRWHAWLLRMPWLGRLIRTVNTSRLTSTLAILVGSGVPLLAALQTSVGVVSNLPMRAAVSDIQRRVREGASLHRAIATTGRFPPIMAHLVASGEASGQLASMLERIAQQQGQELDNRVQAMSALLEPLLILVMGGVVLVIVLAILLPIFEMNQLIR